MSYIRTYPPQVYNSDSSIFDGGIRFSDDFIKREHLQEYKSVWIYIDTAKNKIGIKFHQNYAPQSIKLTPSGKETSSKIVWCAYLKKYPAVKIVMEDKDIKNRRFPVKKLGDTIDNGEIVEYEIDLSDYMSF